MARMHHSIASAVCSNCGRFVFDEKLYDVHGNATTNLIPYCTKCMFSIQIPCACGCGELIHAIDKWYRKRTHKRGHNNRNDGNAQWGGSNTGYGGIHSWIRRHKPEVKFCEKCNAAPPYDLANLDSKYTRDLNTWNWLCRRCHMLSDGRMNNLKRYPKGTHLIDMSTRRCSRCGSNSTSPNSRGRPFWLYIENKIVCRRCYSHHYNPQYYRATRTNM
jgi:hypothetical protein